MAYSEDCVLMLEGDRDAGILDITCHVIHLTSVNGFCHICYSVYRKAE